MPRQFNVGEIVRRNPRIWTKPAHQAMRFKVIAIHGAQIVVQKVDARGRIVREEDVWNPGRTTLAPKVPYQANELVAI